MKKKDIIGGLIIDVSTDKKNLSPQTCAKFDVVKTHWVEASNEPDATATTSPCPFQPIQARAQLFKSSSKSTKNKIRCKH
jgi:hypothetical protein